MKPSCILRNTRYPMQFPAHVHGKGSIAWRIRTLAHLSALTHGKMQAVRHERTLAQLPLPQGVRGEMHREAREAFENLAILTGRMSNFVHREAFP